MTIEADTLRLRTDAYKNVSINGKCDFASIDAKHTYPYSKFNAAGLPTNVMQIACGAAGTHTSIHVTQQLWITDALGSHIEYIGNPDIMQANIHYSSLSSSSFH